MRNDKHIPWMLVVFLSIFLIYGAGVYVEGLRMAEDAVYEQVIHILNDGENTAFTMSKEDLDAPIPLNLDRECYELIDYNLMNSRWADGPHPEGTSEVVVGKFNLTLERIEGSWSKPARWERSD